MNARSLYFLLAITLLGAGGCALLDAMGAFGNCETQDDCSFLEYCTTEGCTSRDDFYEGGFCIEDNDCRGVNTTSIPCPGAASSCRCVADYCVYDTGIPCATSGECGRGEYCITDLLTCQRPYACVDHEDCSYGFCTLDEGCASRLDRESCSEYSPCATGECLGGGCYESAGTSCDDGACSSTQYCSAEDLTCYNAIRDEP